MNCAVIMFHKEWNVSGYCVTSRRYVCSSFHACVMLCAIAAKHNGQPNEHKNQDHIMPSSVQNQLPVGLLDMCWSGWFEQDCVPWWGAACMGCICEHSHQQFSRCAGMILCGSCACIRSHAP